MRTLALTMAELRSDSTQECLSGIRAAAVMKRDIQIVIPELIRLLDREPFVLRLFASDALSKLGRSSVPFLIQSLRASASTRVKEGCIITLSKLGPRATQAIPELTRCLRKKSFPLRVPVAFALGSIKSTRKELKDALSHVLTEKNITLQIAAAAALLMSDRRNIDGILVIVAALRSKYPHRQRLAAQAIGKIQHPSRPIIDSLKALLNNSDLKCRIASAVSLMRHGMHATRAGKVVIGGLNAQILEVRQDACISFNFLPIKLKREMLHVAFKSRYQDVRDWAVFAQSQAAIDV